MGTISLSIDNHIATLTLKCPPANPLSSRLIKDIDNKLNEIKADGTVKVAILNSEGKFFSAGADIKEFTSLQKASDYESLGKLGQKVFNRIETFSIPFIAAIHGAALGGGLELAMSCHIRIVAESAKLGLPEMTLGIIPGFAGSQRLPMFVGSAKAYEMLLTGEPISGKEAFEFGLANRAVSDDAYFNEAMSLAQKIASKSKPAINQIMKLVPFAKTTQFSEGVDAESKAFGKIFGTNDAKEGIQAFLEKRKPEFKDN